jgi:hypothetical protein
LADFVASLGQTDEDDEEDGEGEDDRRPILVGKDAAVDALVRAVRGEARARAMGRARNGRIIEWLGDRGLPDNDLLPIGESIQVQAAARRLVSPFPRYYFGLPLPPVPPRAAGGGALVQGQRFSGGRCASA